MIFSFFISILFAITLTASLALTPLNLRIWILLTALIISLTILFSLSTWFGILLFLIYIGGILVIFSYFVAIAPNFELRLKFIFSSSILYFFILFIFLQKFTDYISIIIINFSAKNIYSLFESFNILILISLGIFLFLALVIVVKVSNRSSGPLRPFIKYVFTTSKKTPPIKAL